METTRPEDGFPMRCSQQMEGFLLPEIGLRIVADRSFFCPLSKRSVRVAIVLLNADVLINLLWLGVTKDDQRSVLLKVLVDSDRLIWTQVDI